MNLDHDVHYSTGTYGHVAPPRRRRGLLGYVLPVIGIAAFAGAVVVVYGGGSGSGGIGGGPPLIEADATPTKLRPEEPGGMEVPHQDKLVYERLHNGAPKPTVERLLPPPETPLPRPVVTPQLPPPVPMPTPPGLAQVIPPPPQTAPTPELFAETSPAPPPAAAAPAPRVQAAPPPAATQPAPRPQAAPPPAQAAAPPKPAPAPAQTAALPPPAATPAKPAGGSGNWRVQLASVRSEGEAQSEWKRLQSRYGDALGGLSMSVVRADLGEKGVYYRVQGTGLDEERARSVCNQLKAQNVGCVVVRP